MLSNAKILGELTHWPPRSVLVSLGKPLSYHVDGKKHETQHVVVTVRNSQLQTAGEDGTHVYPCTAEGIPVLATMTPINVASDGSSMTEVLGNLGYSVT